MRGYIKWQHVQHSLLYLQTNALGTVDYLEIEYLSKVHPEVGVQGATVCSWNFFVIIKDLGEKRAPGNIFSSSFFGPKHEENKRDENIHKNTVKVQFIIITETPANRCDIPTCDKYSAIKFSHFNKKNKTNNPHPNIYSLLIGSYMFWRNLDPLCVSAVSTWGTVHWQWCLQMQTAQESGWPLLAFYVSWGLSPSPTALWSQGLVSLGAPALGGVRQ